MKGVGMDKMQEELEDILCWFGDTYLAISGSTDDVDLIEKEHEELLCQAEQKLLSAGFVKLDSVECENPRGQLVDGWSHLQCVKCKLPIPKIEIKIKPQQEFCECKEPKPIKCCDLSGKVLYYDCDKCNRRIREQEITHVQPHPEPKIEELPNWAKEILKVIEKEFPQVDIRYRIR